MFQQVVFLKVCYWGQVQAFVYILPQLHQIGLAPCKAVHIERECPSAHCYAQASSHKFPMLFVVVSVDRGAPKRSTRQCNWNQS